MFKLFQTIFKSKSSEESEIDQLDFRPGAINTYKKEERKMIVKCADVLRENKRLKDLTVEELLTVYKDRDNDSIVHTAIAYEYVRRLEKGSDAKT